MAPSASSPRLILASASPRRKELLAQIGVIADLIAPADIDESPLPKETPTDYVRRVAIEKGRAVSSGYLGDLVLSADTVVACGRRILPKAETEQEARACLALLSGRGHRVTTCVVLSGPDSEERVRLVETRVKVKRLSDAETDAYIASDEWRGKAGGYAIQGFFAAHIVGIVGSYSSVVGLPLYETSNLLLGAGRRAP